MFTSQIMAKIMTRAATTGIAIPSGDHSWNPFPPEKTVFVTFMRTKVGSVFSEPVYV